MGGAAKPLPICVDLDGTLVRTDLFVERLIGRALSLTGVPSMLRAAWRGRAALKRALAQDDAVDVSTLPYREELIGWLRWERSTGRRIVLATAADRLLADRIAAHLDVFDEVHASDGTLNLKRRAKAAALQQRFGPQGFTYVGDSRADLPVWGQAGSAVLVDASPALRRAVERLVPIEARFEAPPGQRFRALLRALRPTQWIKNLLVFVPMVTARAYGDATGWLASALTFLAFCALASSVYFVNDLLDLPADRAHPEKRARPLAAGELHPASALVTAVALFAAGLTMAGMAGAIVPAAAYAALGLVYSARLKAVPLVDVFALATLYTLRVIAGGEASGHAASQWLLTFSGFAFLALAVMKRVAELRARRADRARHNGRRGYLPDDVSYLEMLGIASSMTAAVVLALFVQSQGAVRPLRWPLLLQAVVPVMLLWQARLWLATMRGQMREDPLVFAVRDRVSVAGAFLMVILFVMSA